MSCIKNIFKNIFFILSLNIIFCTAFCAENYENEHTLSTRYAVLSTVANCEKQALEILEKLKKNYPDTYLQALVNAYMNIGDIEKSRDFQFEAFSQNKNMENAIRLVQMGRGNGKNLSADKMKILSEAFVCALKDANRESVVIVLNYLQNYLSQGSGELGIEILKALKDVENPKLSPLLFYAYATGHFGYEKDFSRAVKFIPDSSDTLARSEFFYDVEQICSYRSNGNELSFEFLDILTDNGCCTYNYYRLSQKQEEEFAKKYPENKYVKFLKACKFYKAGDSASALKILNELAKQNFVMAKVGLYADALKNNSLQADALLAGIPQFRNFDTQWGIFRNLNDFGFDNAGDVALKCLEFNYKSLSKSNILYTYLNVIDNFCENAPDEFISRYCDLLDKFPIEIRASNFNKYFKIGSRDNYKRALEIAKYTYEQNYPTSAYYPLMYYYGYGVQKDEKKAFELLNEDSVKMNLSVLRAYFYKKGIGVKQDLKKAQELDRADDGFGLYAIFSSKPNNRFVIRIPDKEEFERQLIKYSQQFKNLRMLIDAYDEKGELENPKKAFELYIKNASERDFHYFKRAVRLMRKHKFYKDASEYFDLIERYKAAAIKANENSQLKEALYLEASSYYKGISGKQDRARAVKILQEIQQIDKENCDLADELLAYCYDKGQGVAQDKALAAAIREKIKKYENEKDPNYCLLRVVINNYTGSNKNSFFPRDLEAGEMWTQYFNDTNPSDFSDIYMCRFARKRGDFKNYAKYFKSHFDREPNGKENEQNKFIRGLMQILGLGWERDVKAGLAALEQVAQKDSSYCEVLSYLYQMGIGVEKNEAKASEYFEKFSKNKRKYFTPYYAVKYVRGDFGFKDEEYAKKIIAVGAADKEKHCEQYLSNPEKFNSYVKNLPIFW